MRNYSIAPAPDRRGRVIDPTLPPMPRQPRPRPRRSPATEPLRTDQHPATNRPATPPAQQIPASNPLASGGNSRPLRSGPATEPSAARAVQRNGAGNRPTRAAEPRSGPRAATVSPGRERVSTGLTAPAGLEHWEGIIDRINNPRHYCQRCGKEYEIPENIKNRVRNEKRFCSDSCRASSAREMKRKSQGVEAARRAGATTTREHYFQRATH